MKRKLFIILAIVGLLAVGCSSGEVKPPTCEVYVGGNQIHVVVELPAEGMAYHDTQNLTPSGFTGTPSKVTIEAGGSSIEYSQTGNTYEISYTVTYEGGQITEYFISVKGNVYGDMEHTCTQ